MSVQLIQMTVIIPVLTLMAPTLVPVIVDIRQTMMEEHAMVCVLQNLSLIWVYIAARAHNRVALDHSKQCLS